MATRRRLRTARAHDADALHLKWAEISQQLSWKAEEAAKYSSNREHPSHRQLGRIASVLGQLHQASARMPMLVYRLDENPRQYAEYDRQLLSLSARLAGISAERILTDRSYAKRQTEKLRRLNKEATPLSAEICKVGDDLQWIDIVYGD